MAQDDVRENQLVDLFNLERPLNRVRHGTDAILKLAGVQYEFELKSVTTAKGGMSTVRDLGKDHIEKWRNKHWIVAFYNPKGLQYCKYGNPDAMAVWIEKIWAYIKTDFDIADHVPDLITSKEMASVIGTKEEYSLQDAKALHKNQYSNKQYIEMMDRSGGYSPGRMLQIFKHRTKYLIERGSTLNNPHIPVAFFADFPTITKEHAETLRRNVRAWLKSKKA